MDNQVEETVDGVSVDQALIEMKTREREELFRRHQDEEKSFPEIWRHNSEPKKAHPEAELSKEERILLIVENMFAPCALPAAGEEISVEQLAEDAAIGFSATSDVMLDVSDAVNTGEAIKNIFESSFKWFGKLNSVFSAGKGVYGVIKFLAKIGKPSKFKRIMAKMEEINQQLRKVESAIHQGFADLIAHDDLVSFRTEVQIPTQILFDLWTRCFLVSGDKPYTDFKKECEGNRSPATILSTLYSYLDQNSGIFASHLKADKYVYSTFKSWMSIVIHHAVRLITIKLFYYGILTAESPNEEEKEKMEATAKDEMKALLGELVRMSEKLNEIELERLKISHTTGIVKEWIKQEFDSVRPDKIDYRVPFEPEFLSKLAYDFREKWKVFNGTHDFYVMICRGRTGSQAIRRTDYFIGDNSRVTVVPNIAYDRELNIFNIYSDGLCLALIQPLTKEILEANKLSDGKQIELQRIIDDGRDSYIPRKIKDAAKENLLDSTKDKICQLLPKKPLLIMYNVDTLPRTITPNVICRADASYFSVGEAWSAPGGPFPAKYLLQRYPLTGCEEFESPSHILQVIFQ